MDFKEYLKIIGALIASIGGSSVVILGLSSYLGKFWADKILEKDKSRYKKELESLKRNYNIILEDYKKDIDIYKVMFLRYSEKQFLHYDELWKSLCDLKFIAEELWANNTDNKIVQFALQLKETIIIVEKSRLIIEEDHYQDLKIVFDKFNQYEGGKKKLIELINEHKKEPNELNRWDRLGIVRDNAILRSEYTNLLDVITQDFKDQIRQ